MIGVNPARSHAFVCLLVPPALSVGDDGFASQGVDSDLALRLTYCTRCIEPALFVGPTRGRTFIVLTKVATLSVKPRADLGG